MSQKQRNSSVTSMSNASLVRDDDWSVMLEQVGRNQDTQAFAKIFSHFAPLIKGFCQVKGSLNLSPESAEELVQEVMVKVWQKASSFDASKASASTWIFSITRNARIDFLRKNSKHTHQTQPLEADDVWEETTENQPFVYLQQVRAERNAKDYLKSLPVEQAQCLIKVYMEGKSHSEIASELDLPLGTVKSRVRLGLKRLQASA